MKNALETWWTELSRGLPRPFWALAVGLFVTRAGTFIVPLLFVYLTQLRGLAISIAGPVVALYGAGALLGDLLGGSLADRVGRKTTMLLSLTSGAAAMLLLGGSTELWQLASCSFLAGATGEAYRPAAQAIVADLVEPAHRLKAFGIQYWAINLGFALAAVVGGFMAQRSFAVLFVGDALTTLALAAIVFRLVPETRPSAAAQESRSASVLAPFFDRAFGPFLLFNFLVVLVFMQHLTGLPADMHAKGLSTQAFGLVIATNGVVIVLVQPWVTARVKAVPRPVLLAVASALTGVGFGLTTLATTLLGYLLTVVLWTLGEVIFAPVNAAVVADLAPTHQRGRYQGAFTVTWSLGAMVSSAAGPWVMDSVGLRGAWLLCAAVGLGTAIAHLVVTARRLPIAASTSRADTEPHPSSASSDCTEEVRQLVRCSRRAP